MTFFLNIFFSLFDCFSLFFTSASPPHVPRRRLPNTQSALSTRGSLDALLQAPSVSQPEWPSDPTEIVSDSEEEPQEGPSAATAAPTGPPLPLVAVGTAASGPGPPPDPPGSPLLVPGQQTDPGPVPNTSEGSAAESAPAQGGTLTGVSSLVKAQ